MPDQFWLTKAQLKRLTSSAADAGGDIPKRGCGDVSENIRSLKNSLEGAAQGFMTKHKAAAQRLVRDDALPSQ